MTDYASFKYGAVQFPLPVGDGIGGVGASLLRDADPALFYLLEFYAAVIRRHVGGRLLAEVAAGSIEQITKAVAETLPLNPEHFLVENQLNFPLLAAYRKGSKFQDIGGQKHSVDELDVSYVLPPLQAGEAERLLPILKAVASILDNRTEQGMDPLYTPTGSTAGALVWGLAGVTSAEVKGVTYGGYSPTDELFFPAVVLHVELKERSDVAVTEFESFNGADVSLDLEDPVQETVITDFVQFATGPAPTVTVASPNNGSKTGGTTVTLTGTGFVPGTTPDVTFGGLAATSVTVLSTTALQCVTPSHEAFATFIADVVVTNLDGQSYELTAGYTFTTP